MENNQEFKWRKRKKRNARIAAWIIVVIILSALSTFVHKGMKDSEPQNVAERYFREHAAVDVYEVTEGTTSVTSDNRITREYTFSYIADGREMEKVVTLLQLPEKKYFLFDRWEVSSVETNLTDVELIVPVDSQVLIDGVVPDESQKRTTDGLSSAVECYELTGLEGGKTKITITGLPFDTKEIIVDRNMGTIDARKDLTVGTNAQNQMLEMGKSMLLNLYQAAAMLDDQRLEECFETVSGRKKIFETACSSFYDKEGMLLICDLSFDEFKETFDEVYFSEADEEPYIGMTMKLDFTGTFRRPSEPEFEEYWDDWDEEYKYQQVEGEPLAQESIPLSASFEFRYQNGECIPVSMEIPKEIASGQKAAAEEAMTEAAAEEAVTEAAAEETETEENTEINSETGTAAQE